MDCKALIFGFGSIAQKHLSSLKKIIIVAKIYVYSRRTISYKFSINSLNQILEINPDYFIIASETSSHYKYLKFIVQNYNNKVILVEKPLFEKFKFLRIKNNKVFVGYNLRVHPIMIFLKKILKNKKILHVDAKCGSYLPKWRSNRNYIYSSSAKKKLGGGVLLDLSHELDYVNWLFGPISPLFVKNGKVSNLKISTDDLLILYAKNRSRVSFNISLNYFSRIPIRQVSINGDNISILSDFIENKVQIINYNKKKDILFDQFDINDTYYELHKRILNNNFKYICNYKEALQTMKLIDRIRSFK